MALIKCHECEAEISSSAKVCPKCGVKRNQLLIWPLFAVPAALLGAFLLFGMAVRESRTPEQNKQLAAIRYCEDQPEYEQGNAIAVGACKYMKANYIQRWGTYP